MTPKLASTDEILEVADAVRRRVLLHTIAANGGYLCQACSSAEALATLYMRIMRLGPSIGPMIPPRFEGVPHQGRRGGGGAAYNGADEPGNDRFILSCTHYSLALYALLIETGRLGEDALAQYNADGSTVEQIGAEHSPGIEVTTGSLAQGLSQALGMAIGRRRNGRAGRIFVYMSDGELEEGETWEAFNMAAHHRVDNLVVYLDANDNQCDGPIEAVSTIEPIPERIGAFGWSVTEVDGHSPDALAAPATPPTAGRPLAVICRTSVTHGIPSLSSRTNKHYVRFRPGEAEAALADLGMATEVAR